MLLSVTTSMTKNKSQLLLILLIAVLGILILGGIGVLFFNKAGIGISTDKNHYQADASLKVKLSNSSLKKLCFSSCYPYFLERKAEEWLSYPYQNCDHEDRIEKCAGGLKIKAFETTLPEVETGVYRLAIPVCEGCSAGEEFRETNRLYSNEFVIEAPQGD